MHLKQRIVLVVVEYPCVISSYVISEVSENPNICDLADFIFALSAHQNTTFANLRSLLFVRNKNYINGNKITYLTPLAILKLLNNNVKNIWSAFCKRSLVNMNRESGMNNQKQYSQMSCQPAISSHAQQRMDLRGMSERDIELVLKFGRKIHSRRTVFHVIGRKEIKKYASECPELKELDGLHVLTVPQNGTVLTAYRNHDFRHIRPSKRKDKHLH